MTTDTVLTIQDVEALAMPPLQRWCFDKAQLMAKDEATANLYAWNILLFLTNSMHHPSTVLH